MQIVTIDDQDFPQLQLALKRGKAVGTYWRQGSIRKVLATKEFVIVCLPQDPDKVGIKHARSLAEAESLALTLLIRERRRGNEVQLEPDYGKEIP